MLILAAVAAVWIPLAAELTLANTADNEVASALIKETSAEARYLLGDIHYNAPNVRRAWEQDGRVSITPQYGPVRTSISA